MDLVVNYPPRAMKAEKLQRCPCRHGHHRTYLRFLAVFGVLAFIFSATSPYDDDIQQEFCQISKSKQCVLTNYKAVRNLGTSRICAAHYALASPTPQAASYDLIVCVSLTNDKIKDSVCSGASRDRSPPVKTS
jgi:hypothetical protein